MLRDMAVVLSGVAFICAGAACGGGPTASTGALNIVAGENFWSSIAGQLGGSKVTVQSVVTDPNADPHEYESNTNDARAFAEADLVILNGAGYDDWGQKLLDANASSHRKVLNLAELLGRRPGDNPHLWYDPGYVLKVADMITSEYKSIDAGDAQFFDEQSAAFTNALKPYAGVIARIKSKFAGGPIGSTESIFVYMAGALSLNLTSPPAFMEAIAEETDPPASAV